jgi:hypothetical protein
MSYQQLEAGTAVVFPPIMLLPLHYAIMGPNLEAVLLLTYPTCFPDTLQDFEEEHKLLFHRHAVKIQHHGKVSPQTVLQSLAGALYSIRL